MDRTNHYERAFEAYLRRSGARVVPVDESKRSQVDGEPVKSADFLVVGPGATKLVVDVKGRRFPGGSTSKPRPVWQNWSTQADLSGLQSWAEGFGEPFRGVLAFVYEIVAPYRVDADAPDRLTYQGREYLVRGIDVLSYSATMVPRSRRWGTVHLPGPAFRALCRPFSYFFNAATAYPSASASTRELSCGGS